MKRPYQPCFSVTEKGNVSLGTTCVSVCVCVCVCGAMCLSQRPCQEKEEHKEKEDDLRQNP